MNHIAVHCVNLTKSFGGVRAVEGLDLTVLRGETLALLGPSGCGKTTTLRLIAGFEAPDAGQVEIGGRLVAGPGVFLPPEQRRIGMVFQDYALFPHLTVAKNVAYGLKRSEDRAARVGEVLALVGLSGLEARLPHELSGGQQQRVALARALAPQPEVLLLDEPFSNLDARLRTQVRGEVRNILKATSTTAIFVTHDQEEALYMGDQVGVMNAGQLEQIDTPEAIFHRPATPFVAQFVGIADFLVGEVQDRAIATEVGCLPICNELLGGTSIKVMMRPDFIDIRPSVDGVGVIVDREFQGIHYLYRVQLPSGATIQCLQHHNRSYPINTRVAIQVNPDHDVVYFVGRTDIQVAETRA